MPSTEAMEIRRNNHKGLTSPELATLIAYTKIVLEDEILASDLPDDPYLEDRLINYFPSAMRERYADQMPEHRLHREIIATVVVTTSSTIRHHLFPPAVRGDRGRTGGRDPGADRRPGDLWCGRSRQGDRALDHQIGADVQTRCGWRCAPWWSGPPGG